MFNAIHHLAAQTSLIIKKRKSELPWGITTLVRMTIIKNSTNKCWKGCGVEGTLLHCWWESQLVQPLCRTVGGFLKKLKIQLLYDPAILPLGKYSEETIIQKDTCTPMYRVLFIRARTWRQLKCPLTRMDKDDAVHIYNGIFLSHKTKEIMPFAATWITYKVKWVRKRKIDTMCYCLSVQFSRWVMSDSLRPHGLPPCPGQASCPSPNFRSLLKLMSIETVMPSNHLILCCPLLLPPSIFPSIRVFSNESVLWIKCPKYWRFSFHISPSNGYSGLISFMMDWLDLLAVQGTLKSLLQRHSWKASILCHSAFFKVQLTSVRDYWKNHSFD